MEAFCRETGARYRHFLYGGAPGVAERVASVLSQKFGVNTVGIYSPPFRPLTDEENAELNNRIRQAAPDVVWVCLGAPKQERWMYEHYAQLRVPALVGVGAAFDFLAGTSQLAPQWMRENGLEWLFRLTQEPRRLWRRYILNGSLFVWKVGLELLGFEQFHQPALSGEEPR
jgi:N-acetylglucosaminyldiphosphoundecaprenol N-acetyl-beta-D-mannosaminyltransferase